MNTPALVNNYTNANLAGMCFEKTIEIFDQMSNFLTRFTDSVAKTVPRSATVVQFGLLSRSFFDRLTDCARTFGQLRNAYEELMENPNTSRIDLDLLFTQMLSADETFVDLCRECIDLTFEKYGVELIAKNQSFEFFKTQAVDLIVTLRGLLNQLPTIMANI